MCTKLFVLRYYAAKTDHFTKCFVRKIVGHGYDVETGLLRLKVYKQFIRDNDSFCLFHCINICLGGGVFNQLSQDQTNVDACKIMWGDL